jgi:cell division protein FtsB
MELPVDQIAPDALLAAATTRFEALSGNLKATADQMAQLKAQHDAAQRSIALLTSERDALSARLATLQAEFQDAATRHAPPVELLPFARRVLELSSHAGIPPHCPTSGVPHAPCHRRHHPSRRCRPCRCCPTSLLLPRLPRHRPRRPNRTSLLPPRSNQHSRRNNPRSSTRWRPRLRP